MGYLVCGSVRFRGTSPRNEETLRRTAALALAAGMNVQFGCNIVLGFVFEIVGRHAADSNVIPFLLTSSVLADTSDDLVSPYMLIGPGADDEFRSNAGRIASFVRELFSNDDVASIDLYITDGFDDSLPSRRIRIGEIESALLSAWKRRDEDFAFRLEVRKVVEVG